MATIFEYVESAKGRRDLASALQLCEVPVDAKEANTTVSWLLSAIGTMAMGSYPFASSYLLGGDGFLPPYPLRQACAHLEHDFADDAYGRLSALGEAVGVFYNYSNQTECFLPLNNFRFIVHGGASEQMQSYMEAAACGYLHCTVMPMPASMDGEQVMWNVRYLVIFLAGHTQPNDQMT